MLEIKKLQEELRELKAAQVSFCAEVKEDGDNWTAERELQFNNRQNDIAELEKKIKAEEKYAITATYNAKESAKESYSPKTGTYSVTPEDRKLAFQAWCLNHLKGGRNDITKRHREAAEKCGFDLTDLSCVSFDQTIGTANQGGNLLDGSLYQGMVERSKEIGGVESLATVVTTPGNSDIHWATTDNTSRTLTKITELGQATNTAVTWDKVTIGAYRYTTGAFPLSQSFVRNFPGSATGYFSGVLADTIARSKNNILTLGDGSGDPQGLLTGLSAGETAADTAEISYAELDNLVSSVDSSYHSNAVFMMNRKTFGYFNMAETDEGLPIFRESWALGGPRTLLGFPVVFNPDMPDIGAGTSPILFGDIRQAYVVRNVGSVTIDVSPYQYWLEQALAIAAWLEFSGAVVNTHAAKKFTMAAS